MSVTIASSAVRVDDEGRVDELAVDLAGERGLGEAGADRCGDLGHRDRLVELRIEPSGSFTFGILFIGSC